MSQYYFGSGSLFGIDNTASPPTPVKFGALQDVSIEFSLSIKELYGQHQFPLAIGRGKSKITGKAKLGQVQGDLYNSLFFGATKSSGEVLAAIEEVGTIPGEVPYTITVANAANFDTDLGVIYADNGKPLTRVAENPTEGQYSVDVATGVYTFSTADGGKEVKINYLYTSNTGSTITISNQLMGVAPTFKVVLTEKFRNKTVTLILNACTSSKLTLPTKEEDFMISEFDFEAMADDAGNVGKISVAE